MTQAPAAVATELSFAHLTDPHLTQLRAVDWRQLLNKRLLGYLSWLQKRRDEHRPEILQALVSDLRQALPEQIVITGDMTHIGLPEEFRQVRQWLEQLGPGDQVTVIPGNHDAYVQTEWASTYAQWLPYMQSDQVYRAGSSGFEMFPTLRIRKHVAVIGLSSAVATAPFLATGRVGEAQRERLARLLRDTREQGLFRLVLLHHPPRVEDEKWRKRLTDGNELCEVLKREGAELVLHGHGHDFAESAIPAYGGEIPVFGIPSASAIGRKPGRRAQYWLYRIGRRDGQWSVTINARGYRLESGSFVELETRHLLLPAMPSTSS